MTAAVLQGRVAIVAGGGWGIARGVALGLADHGAAVAVVGRSVDTVATETAACGSRAVAVDCGFQDRAETEAAFARAAAALGPIDLVVHALVDREALVACPLADADETSWDAHGETLLRAALWTCQAAGVHLAGRGGTIVFVTPTAGMSGAAGLVPYLTAVEGQRALAKSAARQWGSRGIRVNCVAPPLESMGEPTVPGEVGGALNTAALNTAALNTAALGRYPDPRADVAPVIAMLAADTGHFVTGATIAVDGGIWMAP